MSDSTRMRPPWWLKYVNKAMVALQRRGAGSGADGPAVLTVPGRKSGKLSDTPVTPVTVERQKYIVGGVPSLDWATNARAADEVTLRKGRHIERVRLVEMPLEDARRLLREFPVKVPTGIGFMKDAGLVPGPNPDEFEKLAGRCPVLRLDPVTA